MVQTDLIQCQFKSRYGDGFGGRLYTYIADVPLRVGDIVIAPTVNGDGEARVTRIDVSEAELPPFLTRDKLRHISELAPAPDDQFEEFFK